VRIRRVLRGEGIAIVILIARIIVRIRQVLPPSPGHDHGGKARGGGIGNIDEIGWRDDWKRAIVADTGDRYKVKTPKAGSRAGEAAFSSRQEERKRRVVEGKHSKADVGGNHATTAHSQNFWPERAVVA